MELQFGRFLQERLREQGWSYSDLATRSGLHVSLISRVARGERRPTVNFVRHCAEALGGPLPTYMAAAGMLDEAISSAGTPEANALAPYMQYAATVEGEEEIEQRLPSKLDRLQQLEDPTGKIAVLLDWVNQLAGRFRESSNGTVRTLIGGALLYVMSPIDLVPDFIPLAGLMDDLSVVALVIGMLSKLPQLPNSRI